MQWCHWWCCWHQVWHWCHCQWHQMTKKSWCTPFLLSWPKKWIGAIYDTFGIIWGWHQCQWCHMTKTSFCISHFDNFDLKNAVMSLMMLLMLHNCNTNAVASHDTNTNAIGIMWCQCWCQWHHTRKKNYVEPHLNCLSLRTALVPLMILLASYDIYYHANDIKWWKSHVTSDFNWLDLRNAVVPFCMHWHGLMPRPVPQASFEQKVSFESHFNCLDLL